MERCSDYCHWVADRADNAGTQFRQPHQIAADGYGGGAEVVDETGRGLVHLDPVLEQGFEIHAGTNRDSASRAVSG